MLLYKDFGFKTLKILLYMHVEMISEKFLHLVRGKELKMQRELGEYGWWTRDGARWQQKMEAESHGSRERAKQGQLQES